MTSEKKVDTGKSPGTMVHQYKKPLKPELWLERAHTSFRDGQASIRIPMDVVFYVKALLRDKLGYDIPILVVEQILKEEGMLDRHGKPVKNPPEAEHQVAP